MVKKRFICTGDNRFMISLKAESEDKVVDELKRIIKYWHPNTKFEEWVEVSASTEKED